MFVFIDQGGSGIVAGGRVAEEPDSVDVQEMRNSFRSSQLCSVVFRAATTHDGKASKTGARFLTFWGVFPLTYSVISLIFGVVSDLHKPWRTGF